MRLERIKLVKEGKPIARVDFAVYAALFFTAIFLFSYFVFPPKKLLDGIAVYLREEEIFRYEFGKGAQIGEGCDEIIFCQEEGTRVKITYRSGEDWNVILLDTGEQSAKMIEANCSVRKDCTRMQPLKSARGAIICAPHKLKILPLDGEADFSSPTLG